MGMMPKLFSCDKTIGPPIAPNPDPKNFKIKRTSLVNSLTITLVAYPGCTTYNGDKILVFECNVEEILQRQELDPHFQEDDVLIARFPASYTGWEDAIKFASNR